MHFLLQCGTINKTMSEIRVTNVIGENGNSPVNFTKGINMSGICTAPAFIPSQGQLSHRNLIINGWHGC